MLSIVWFDDLEVTHPSAPVQVLSATDINPGAFIRNSLDLTGNRLAGASFATGSITTGLELGIRESFSLNKKLPNWVNVGDPKWYKSTRYFSGRVAERILRNGTSWGRRSGYVGLLITGVQLYRGDIDGNEASMDAVHGGIGFIPYIGPATSGYYFIAVKPMARWIDALPPQERQQFRNQWYFYRYGE